MSNNRKHDGFKHRSGSAVWQAVVDALLLDPSLSAAEIYRDLKRRFPADVPNVRTVQNWVNRLQRKPGDPWELTDFDDPDEVAFLMEIETYVRIFTKGAPAAAVTTADATWLLRLRKATEGLHAIARLRIARLCELQLEDQKALECFLALRPWESREKAQMYVKSVEHGIVPRLLMAEFFGLLYAHHDVSSAAAISTTNTKDVTSAAAIARGKVDADPEEDADGEEN